VQQLATILGVGRVVALTWALEMGDITRFVSVKKAVSYCGLCGAETSSGGKTERTPISKTKKQAFPNDSSGSGKTAAVLEPGPGAGLRARETEIKSQPGYTGCSAQ
jgi:hypothetical protein